MAWYGILHLIGSHSSRNTPKERRARNRGSAKPQRSCPGLGICRLSWAAVFQGRLSDEAGWFQEPLAEHDVARMLMGMALQSTEREDNVIVNDLRGELASALEDTARVADQRRIFM